MKNTKELLNNLNEMLNSIEASKPSSAILLAAGIESSQQSVSIKVGNALEKWWNTVTKTLDDSSAEKQVDYFFEKGGRKYYFELKCNTHLDSEKSVATMNKIEKTTQELGADESGVFNPTALADYYSPQLKEEVYGVRSLLEILNAGFTADEYHETWTNGVKNLFIKESNKNVKTNSKISGRED
tara:strand:+ start:240 stop:791 length:552 start_codon:yes stop_codon:yes gene_type:complete